MSGTATTVSNDAVVDPPTTQGEAGPRRRWAITAVLLVLMLVVFSALASNTEPLTRGSGGYGVLGHDDAITHISVTGAESVYITPYIEGHRVTILFPVTNDGRIPVRLREVFPPDRAAPCGWQPQKVAMRRSGPEGWRAFEETTLWRGDTVELAVTGAFACEYPPAVMEALMSYGPVPVRYSLAGLASRTSDIHPGFSFHWTTADIDLFTEDLVTVQPPMDPDSFLPG